MSVPERGEASRRITIELPVEFIEHFDQLKREWGLRARGDVLKRLLDEVMPSSQQLNLIDSNNSKELEGKENLDKSSTIQSLYNETTALVLISNNKRKKINDLNNNLEYTLESETPKDNSSTSYNKGIDLPGFVSKNAKKIRTSLETKNRDNAFINESYIKTISIDHLTKAKEDAIKHWISLYGNQPKENVIEAAMLWLARDIWPNLDNTEGLTFTWTLANRMLREYCPVWQNNKPSLERIIVIAGILEDPFASDTLSTRIPTLIRRFVNRFKRNQNVTSFQTLESTMTVHGALKFLDLPTTAGASLTLKRIRDAYKTKAMAAHPDSGGNTDSMRRVNEAYQLLKDLYKKPE